MSESRLPWWRRIRGEVALSLAATALSLCAVVTTAWQAAIMRAQLRASVWPRLQIALKYFGENESQYFRLHVDNVGVGPAVVTSFRVTYRGKDFHSVIEAFNALRAERQIPTSAITHTENDDPHPEQVLPQQQSAMILMARGPGREAADLMHAMLGDLKIQLRYASIYGEEWETSFPAGGLRRVGWRDVQ